MASQIQRRIDLLGEQLGRSVVLADAEVRLMYCSRHYGDEDAVRIRGVLHRDAGSRPIAYVLGHGISSWTRPGRIPAAPELDMSARFVAPVRWHGEYLGAVFVMDADGSLTGPQEALVDDFARAVAGLVLSERRTGDDRTHADEDGVLQWLGLDVAARAAAVAGLRERALLPDLEHVRVLVARTVTAPSADEPVDVALRHALTAAGRGLRGTALIAVRGGEGTLAVVSATSLDDDHAGDVAALAVRGFGEFLGREPALLVGVGDSVGSTVGGTVGGVADAWRSRRQAELAARAVPLLGEGPTAFWHRLGVLQVLVRIPPEEADPTLVPPPVAALVAADQHGRLVETLEAYLRTGGSGSATAAALHIHRTTLYYRLDRIREVTGLDIDDGAARLELQLGLAARRLPSAPSAPSGR